MSGASTRGNSGAGIHEGPASAPARQRVHRNRRETTRVPAALQERLKFVLDESRQPRLGPQARRFRAERLVAARTT